MAYIRCMPTTNIHPPRPSSLPVLMACPQSHLIVPGEVHVEAHSNLAATLGTELHKLYERYIVQPASYDALRAEAERLERQAPHYADARYLFQEGVRLYREKLHYFLAARTGNLVTCPDFEGTPDVISVDQDIIAVGDWKTGYSFADAYHQIMAYLHLLRLAYPGRDRFYGFAWLVRHDHTMTIETDIPGLDGWLEQYRTAYSQISYENTASYRINRNCENCRRLLFCPAIKAAAASLAMVGPQGIRQAAGRPGFLENLRYTRDAVKAMKRIGDAVDSTIDALVEQNGGQIDLNGSTIERRVQWRKSFNTERALPILREILGEHVGKVATITTTAIRRAVVDAFPERRASEVMDAIMTRLAEADAVNEYPVTRLETVN